MCSLVSYQWVGGRAESQWDQNMKITKAVLAWTRKFACLNWLGGLHWPIKPSKETMDDWHYTIGLLATIRIRIDYTSISSPPVNSLHWFRLKQKLNLCPK